MQWKYHTMLLLFSALFLTGLDVALCEKHFVVPSNRHPCHEESCVTLSYFSENCVDTNTSLTFAEGYHTLNVSICVSNITTFSMLAKNNSVNITCSDHAYFKFSSIGLVYISNLTFIACDNNIIESVEQFILKWSNFVGRWNKTTETLLSIVETNAYIDATNFSNGTGMHSSQMIWNQSEDFSGTIGGAMVVLKSNLTMNNSKFEANRANVGGAIFFGNKSNITINNSEFTFNCAIDCPRGLCFGGALFVNEKSKVIINNSKFENNTSDGDGGMAAISNASLLVSQTYIFNNRALNKGGGAVAACQHSILVFNISTLKNNTANTYGGAIYLDGGRATISGGTISNNEANEMGGVLLVLTEGFVEVNNHSTFSNNTAVNGGVIHATDSINHIAIFDLNKPNTNPGLNFSINISNSIFNNNKASLNGGVLSLSYHSTNIAIRNSTFYHNSAGGRGGVISMSGSGNSVVISSSNFSHNIAIIFGGVISLINGGHIQVNNSFFESNFVNVQGGVFDCYTNGNIEIYRSTFTSNSADIGGGVLNIKNGSKFNVKNSDFFNNTDTDLGALFLAVSGNNITIDTCNFTQNSANYGGVLIATWNNSVTVTNSIFHHNRAATNGGTIYTRRMCVTTITNSSFINNTAVNDGNAIAADGSLLHIENSNFSYNTAGHDGGIAYAYDNSTIIFDGCHLNSNRAENSGGVVYGLKNSTIKLNNSIIEQNSAQNSGGGVHAQKNSSIIIEASNLTKNTADYGGGVRVYVKSMATIRNCNFSENIANVAGGSMAAYESSTISVQASNLTLNTANVGGVAIAFQSTSKDRSHLDIHNTVLQRNDSEITFNECSVTNNTANQGGALYIRGSHVTVKYSTFDGNSVRYQGGVIHSITNSSICISSTNFTSNTADDDGGVMILMDNSDANLSHCTFTNNTAKDNSGVMHVHQSKASVFNSIFISSCAGTNGGVLVVLNSSIKVKESCFKDNTAGNTGGALDAYSGSNLTVEDSIFLRNKAGVSGGSLYLAINSSGYVFNSIFQQNIATNYGGAISIKLSSKIIVLESKFFNNTAETGAALAAKEDSLISFGANDAHINSSHRIQIRNNAATRSGGGIYLETSDLNFGISANVRFNTANELGGGLQAINSSIYFKSNVSFHGNQASLYGGGVSLTNSKFYDAKVKGMIINVSFIFNQAYQGGAIYIQDEREGVVCSTNPHTGNYTNESGCFFQNVTNSSLFINFANNSATLSGNYGGNDLFGGLLDRCTVVSNKATLDLEPKGVTRFEAISHLTSYDTVSSKPVRLYLCSEPMMIECGQQTSCIQVKMNDSFSFHVVAVDQVNKTLAATVKSSLSNLTLEESETVQRIGTNCSKLKYHVSFPKSYKTYNLTIFPKGPCGNKSISMLTISIYVINCSCPPGFMRTESDTKCSCVCDKRYKTFSKYVSECNATGRLVIRKGSFWITYLGNSDNDNISPYFLYPYCPLDYCQPPSIPVSVNLSLSNGSDSQCANNRGGILCGKCLPNYSLSLGSSRCIECPDNWYGLLVGIIIAAFFAGIFLVLALLVLNLTVAIGTLNSIVFYANIVYVNRSIYFSQSSLAFASAFISWLNLNIGFNVCFIKGMDSYSKTWLELVFPIYIIILVIVIICTSSHSSKFSNLIGKKNPVATLATLILLSYTKLLETIIISFSFVSLNYPNGTVVTKWLPDASVHFKGWKHAALICMGTFVLILGLLYTTLIFCWQWLLRCSRSKLFKWTRNQKLHSFIDIYHTPYTAKHRYWTGLLLLVRVIVYLVSTFTISVDPRISLFSIVITMCCLLTYKTLLAFRVYKNRLLNVMESFVHFNIAIFAIITWYTLDDPSNRHKETIQRISAYISVGTIFVLFLLINVYHVIRYGSVKMYTVCQHSNFGKKIQYHLECHDQDRDYWTSSNRDSYNLLDLIDDPRQTDGYTAPPLHLHHGPTFTTSTVSMKDSLTSESL